MIKGLLKKDLIMMQGSFKSFPLILVVYIVIGYLIGNMGNMMGMMAFVTAGVVSSSLLVDETCQWDKYVLTMPVSRKNVIQSKFVLLFLIMIPTAVVSILLTYFLADDVITELLSAVIMISVTQLMYSVSIPCTLYWGVRYARIIMALSAVFISIIFLMLLFPLIMLDPIGTQAMEPELAERTIQFTIEMAVAGFAIVSLIATGISYIVACKIYESKEF